MEGPTRVPRDVDDYDPRKAGARCDICPLAGGQVVPGQCGRSLDLPNKEERSKVRLIIVGEQPGYTEQILKQPFQGKSGYLLNSTLEEVGLTREEVYVTNAALCHGDNEKEDARAAECCAPRLLKELAEFDADLPVLALGKSASRAVLGVQSILLARGFVWTARTLEGPIKAAEAQLRQAHKKRKPSGDIGLKISILKARHVLAGRTVLPALHPAFVLRSDAWNPVFKIDLDRAARWVRGELTPEKLKDNIRPARDLKDFKRSTGVYYASDLLKPLREAIDLLDDVVSCDIETTHEPATKCQILCVGISDGKRTVVIGPWSEEAHAPLLTEVLGKRTSVYHNGYGFDQIALRRAGVVIDEAKVEDTLIAHHAFASHYPQRLDHVVSTFCDSSPWKIRFGRRGGEEKGLAPQDMPFEDMAHYNAADCVLTIEAWHAMQNDLHPEAHVYAHDKGLSLMCRGMQEAGMAVSVKRRDTLRHLLTRRANEIRGEMRRLLKRPHFRPGSTEEVRRVLFGTLRAKTDKLTESGIPSTSSATLEGLKKSPTRVGRFAKLMLRWRILTKIRGTYIKPVEVDKKRRTHYGWRPFGTVSGRLACRVQSAPRWSKVVEDRVREIYIAPKGKVLLYYDLSQAESRFAANVSGDPRFIAACEGDVHVGNAKVLFPDAVERLTRDPKGKKCPRHSEFGKKTAKCDCGKDYRDIAKNAGFAVAYLADSETVFLYLRAKGFPVTFANVETMLQRLKIAYEGYYVYVAENVQFVREHGYLRTPLLQRVRWFGFYPKPTEVANLPIQSGIADVMNLRLIDLNKRLPPTATLVAQIHDAAIFEVAPRYLDTLRDMVQKTWDEPVRLPVGPAVRAPREFLLPIEMKEGKRWSDFG